MLYFLIKHCEAKHFKHMCPEADRQKMLAWRLPGSKGSQEVGLAWGPWHAGSTVPGLRIIEGPNYCRVVSYLKEIQNENPTNLEIVPISNNRGGTRAKAHTCTKVHTHKIIDLKLKTLFS